MGGNFLVALYCLLVIMRTVVFQSVVTVCCCCYPLQTQELISEDRVRFMSFFGVGKDER